MAAVALGLARSHGGSLDLESCRQIVKAWLKSPDIAKGAVPNGQRKQAEWLIVFDGLVDTALLRDYVEVFHHGAVLVTSRDPGCARCFLGPKTSIELSPFSDEESTTVLQKILERDQEGHSSTEQNELLKEVAVSLGGWPLALRQMAGIMREQYLSLDEFRDRYKDPEQRGSLQRRAVVDIGDYLERTMADVVTMALECLSVEARCLVGVCAMLDHDCIQEFLFEYTKGLPEFPGFPKWGSAAYFEARMQLIKLGLIAHNKKVWTMHRVIQETIRAQLEPTSFGDKFRFAVTLVATAWNAEGPRQRHHVSSWAHFAKIFSHVLHLQSVYPEYRKHGGGEPYEEFAWLLNEGAW